MTKEKTETSATLKALKGLQTAGAGPAHEKYLEVSGGGRTYRAEEIASARETVTTGGDPRAAYATAKPRRRVIRARIAVD